MIGARIHEGDLVLVRKQPALEEGQIGVFMIEGWNLTYTHGFRLA